jgi:hypothetical protein|tara:strand:+ start:4804 stop:5997 length:1194 start_codon:yes stop_codon:yes gene_type:complete
MDPHTEPVAEESPALESLPDAGDGMSFESSLEAAFAGLDAASDEQAQVEESSSETAEDAEAPAEGDVKETEPTNTTDVAADNADVSDEPLEALSDDIGDDWTPKAASRFKQLKSELKSSKSELDLLRQQQQEYESKIKELTGLTENKDIDALQNKLLEYENQQMLANLENTDAYKEAITEPLAALMERADQIADKYEVDPDVLVDVLALDDPQQQDEQLSELFPNASDRDKARLYRIIEDIDPIVSRREKMFENADAALAEAKLVTEQREAAEAAERASLRVNVTRNVVERVQQKLPFLAGIEGLDMDVVQQQASEIDPSVIHPVDHAYNAVSAQLLPNIVREYVSMRKENEVLTDRLAEYEGAEPTMSGQARDSVAPTGVRSDMSFEESIAAALGA